MDFSSHHPQVSSSSSIITAKLIVDKNLEYEMLFPSESENEVRQKMAWMTELVKYSYRNVFTPSSSSSTDETTETATRKQTADVRLANLVAFAGRALQHEELLQLACRLDKNNAVARASLDIMTESKNRNDREELAATKSTTNYRYYGNDTVEDDEDDDITGGDPGCFENAWSAQADRIQLGARLFLWIGACLIPLIMHLQLSSLAAAGGGANSRINQYDGGSGSFFCYASDGIANFSTLVFPKLSYITIAAFIPLIFIHLDIFLKKKSRIETPMLLRFQIAGSLACALQMMQATGFAQSVFSGLMIASYTFNVLGLVVGMLFPIVS